MKLYYRIWVDCITRLRSREGNKDDWQIISLMAMSIAMTFNSTLLMTILQKHILNHYFYKIIISQFSVFLNNILTLLILFVLPCVLINYFLIFHGKKYEMLTKKYSYYNGKLFLTYFLTSLFLPIIMLVLALFFQNENSL